MTTSLFGFLFVATEIAFSVSPWLCHEGASLKNCYQDIAANRQSVGISGSAYGQSSDTSDTPELNAPATPESASGKVHSDCEDAHASELPSSWVNANEFS